MVELSLLRSRVYVLIATCLCGLAAYILLGIATVPEHGDEYMIMHLGRDYFVWRDGQPGLLSYNPASLLQPDTDMHLRLLNGSVSPYLIGMAMKRAGYVATDLPGIYAWGMSYLWNRGQYNVPPDTYILISRNAVAWFTGLSVFLIFGIGMLIGGNITGLIAAALFALHPAILLNGRRAMMEGPLFFFSLVVILLAIVGLRLLKRTRSRAIMLTIMLIIGICTGLCISSKHPGVIPVVAVLISWVAVGIVRRHLRLVNIAVAAGVIGFTVFLIINPAYWRDPVATLRAMLSARTELLIRQSTNDPTHYVTMGDRLNGVAQFALWPEVAQYYEAPTWSDIPEIKAQITAYSNSIWRGFTLDHLQMWVLTLWRIILSGFVVVGVIATIQQVRRGQLDHLPLLIWLLIAAIYTFSIPLPWERYYLPVILPVLIFAALGCVASVRFILQFNTLRAHLNINKDQLLERT